MMEKQNLLSLGIQQQLQKISHINIQIGEDLVTPMDMVCNLSFFHGSNTLKNNDHINRITSSILQYT